MSIIRLFGVTVLFVVAQQGGVSGQPPQALIVEPVERDHQVVASDLGFINSIRLFVRQWSFGDRPDDSVWPVYRLDTLARENRQLVLESLARSAEDSEVPVVFLIKRVPEGDFVGTKVAIQVSEQDAGQVAEDPWNGLVRDGRKLAASDEQGVDGGLYLAMTEVEGLEPDDDVVFFGCLRDACG